MRRAVARGRMFPQSYSTDRRYGHLSLMACALFPLMWVNCDDQGRLTGDPDEIKYATCPNIDHITKGDIPDLLKELEKQGLIKVYNTSTTQAVQMLDWWEVQRLQWAYPSQYPPPEGWQDRLRYHASPTKIVVENWPAKSDSNSNPLPSASPNPLPSALPNSLGKEQQNSPLTTPPEIKKEKEGRTRRGRGNLPSALGSTPSPSLTADISIFKELTRCFKIEWGRVPANEPDKIIRREPNARESAQLRDLAKNLSAVGGVPLDYIKQAFREAASHDKRHISYVRAILLDWIGIPRGPPE